MEWLRLKNPKDYILVIPLFLFLENKSEIYNFDTNLQENTFQGNPVIFDETQKDFIFFNSRFERSR